MRTELLLIDLDDTLWDTQANNKASLEEVYTALNWGQYFHSFKDYFTIYNLHNMKLWSALAQQEVTKDYLVYDRLRFPLRQYTYLTDIQCQEANELFYERMKEKTLLCPYALEVVQELCQRYSLFLVSNGFIEVQRAKVEHSGLAPYIKGMILSEECSAPKPHREIFDKALKTMNCPSERAVMIGDSWSTDIVGASNAGISSIWYNPHHLYPNDGDITPPIATISDLRELLRIF